MPAVMFYGRHFSFEKAQDFSKKGLTFVGLYYIMAKLSRNAAIAQPVERILGKDEVASSNLASSSKKERPLKRVVFLFLRCARFERSNAARMSAAGEG